MTLPEGAKGAIKVSKPIKTQDEINEIPKWELSMAIGDFWKFRRGH